MIRLEVRHSTTYRYLNPVKLLEHRLMCRPRGSHELRLLDTGINITPPAQLSWLHDVFGNSVAKLNFDQPTDTLVVETSFRAEHFPGDAQQLQLVAAAVTLPFEYPAEYAADLAAFMQPQYPDPKGALAQWAQGFIEARDGDTLAVLDAMVKHIKNEFSYQRRDDEGTWAPTDTLASQSGSCRDYALLMMEALRSIGLAARFVSGYLYDENAANGAGVMLGGGETHAWLDVYLPGEGWVAYDPTNALVAGRNLIPVAIARVPEQASPLSGSFDGGVDDFLGMQVSVTITHLSES